MIGESADIILLELLRSEVMICDAHLCGSRFTPGCHSDLLANCVGICMTSFYLRTPNKCNDSLTHKTKKHHRNTKNCQPYDEPGQLKLLEARRRNDLSY